MEKEFDKKDPKRLLFLRVCRCVLVGCVFALLLVLAIGNTQRVSWGALIASGLFCSVAGTVLSHRAVTRGRNGEALPDWVDMLVGAAAVVSVAILADSISKLH